MTANVTDLQLIYAFVHIEKCGGQSFGRMLRRSFGMRHHDLISRRRDTDVADAADLSHLLRLFPNCRSIMGHNIRPYCDFGGLGSRIVFYTLLRDPVDRYISDYCMHVRGGFQGNFAQWSVFAFQHDLMVKAFSRTADIEEAKATFADTVSLYDTLDHFDRFVGRAHDLLPDKTLCADYRIVNDAPQASLPADARTPSDRARLRAIAAELNRKDVDFFKWAKARLEKSLIAAPSILGQRVEREQGLGRRINLSMNLLARNFIYKPSCGLRPGQVDSISKYRKPWTPIRPLRDACEPLRIVPGGTHPCGPVQLSDQQQHQQRQIVEPA